MQKSICLVAAFDKFGGLSSNHSEQVLEALPSIVDSKITIEKVLLPTCCSNAWDILRPRLDQQPDALVLTGASWNTAIALERFALNIRQYDMKDNGGHNWNDTPIEEDAPCAMRTDLPLRELETKLTEQDYYCEVSNHAGTFVCNEIYFQALRHQQEHSSPRSVLFAHLPPLKVFASRVASQGTTHCSASRLLLVTSKDRQLQLMRDAVVDIIRFSIKQSLAKKSDKS